MFFLLAVSVRCYGQDLLMLYKKNRNKNAYYKPGDDLSFRIKGNKSKITGEIIGFRDSTIVFRRFEADLDQISSIYIDEKTRWWLRYKVEQMCLLAGSGYLVLDVINHGHLSKETAIISGITIGVGLLARLIIGKRIKLKGKTKLKLIEYRP